MDVTVDRPYRIWTIESSLLCYRIVIADGLRNFDCKICATDAIVKYIGKAVRNPNMKVALRNPETEDASRKSQMETKCA